MKKLQISDELALPLDVAVESLAILGTKGSGKSSTGAVLAEELWEAAVQFCVFDPTGVFWGLRSSVDGRGKGIPVIILGGPHGDAPLEPTAGTLIADLLVDTGVSLVLDLSDFPSKTAQTKFATDLAERLYRRKARARSPLHLIVDEAEEFIPQDVRGEGARMVGAWETIVALGRSRGLGETLISRRVQAVNKKVLDLIETLLAMRIGAPLARKRVEEWIEAKEVEDDAGVVRTLKELPTGTAWVWSPLRGQLVEVQIRPIRTFDSYATPKPGEKPREARVLADIDLKALGEQIAATVEQAKAEDPRELRKQIAGLKRRVDAAEKKTQPEPEKIVERVEVPVLDGQVEQLKEVVSQLAAIAGDFKDAGVLLEGVGNGIVTAIEKVGSRGGSSAGRAPANQAGEVGSKPAPRSRPRTAPPSSRIEQQTATSDDDGTLDLAARKMLNVLAQFPEGRTAKQLAILAGYVPGGSSYRKGLGQLRTFGFATPAGVEPVRITDAGLAAMPEVEPLPTGPELYDYWRGQLELGPRLMLEALYAVYPEGLDRDELADQVQYVRGGSSFRKALGRLRTLELATPAGIEPIRAADELFQETAAQ